MSMFLIGARENKNTSTVIKVNPNNPGYGRGVTRLWKGCGQAIEGVWSCYEPMEGVWPGYKRVAASL